jgi:hypothetical protein
MPGASWAGSTGRFRTCRGPDLHPAPSLILFSSLSGLGLGLLAWLSVLMPVGQGAFWSFALALALAGGGFLASTFHLLRPSRAPLAFTQWRSSWLSREAILARGAGRLPPSRRAPLLFRGEEPPGVSHPRRRALRA